MSSHRGPWQASPSCDPDSIQIPAREEARDGSRPRVRLDAQRVALGQLLARLLPLLLGALLLVACAPATVTATTLADIDARLERYAAGTD